MKVAGLFIFLIILLQAFSEVLSAGTAVTSLDPDQYEVAGYHRKHHRPLRRINCKYACARRCSKSSRKNLCNRACNSCCFKCHCVPPGTYGNKHMCPCYARLKTHGNRPKCP